MKRPIVLLFCLTILAPVILTAQQDSTAVIGKKVVTLREVVVRNNLNVAAFIERVKNDTTFYKAFRNLKVLGYTSLNDVQIFDKKNSIKASLKSRTKQETAEGCRWMHVLEENSTGDFYDRNHHYNYYTAQMYAGLFFANDTICGETNIVGNSEFSTRGKSGMEKHKEQLKMLFFNPGKKIPGLPFIGNKIALFEDDVAKYYDMVIDMQEYKGEMCYVFSVSARPDLLEYEKDDVVINEMTTWFRMNDWEIVGRNYDLSYDAGVYDFDVQMEVEMTRFKSYTVPSLLRYNGNWDVAFKKREKAVFTATLFDFTE